MPTPTKGARLGGSPAHQKAILANLATALFEHGSITTTEAKARRLRPYAERLITKAKRGDLAARRQVLALLRDKTVVHVLFTDIGPRYEHRHGGYTRITKLGPRKGDAAPMAVIELVEPLAERTVAEATAATRRAAATSPVSAATAAPSVVGTAAAEPADAVAEPVGPTAGADVAPAASLEPATAPATEPATDAAGSAGAGPVDPEQSTGDAAAPAATVTAEPVPPAAAEVADEPAAVADEPAAVADESAADGDGPLPPVGGSAAEPDRP